ncbi:MAG TPA: zf-HC2 domain-containing protein [Elusimicrobiales bacterium]|nr:zf-HC2 domain-containing protein [Elusimicrobiales bacterium]
MITLCDNLESFHDGELPPDELARMKEHVDTCRYCAEKLQALRALDRLLTPPLKISARDISAAVIAALPAAADAELSHRLWRGWWKVPALVLASCAAFAICVETGLLPSRTYSLAAELAAQSQASQLSSLLFGKTADGDEELLALMFKGEGK